MCFLHSCFQVCSGEATLPQGTDVVCVRGKKTRSEFSLPSPALPGSTRTAAEPGKGPAASGFASARAAHKGWEGEAGALWHPCTRCAGFFPPPLVLPQRSVMGNGLPGLGRATETSRKRFFGSHFFLEGQGQVLQPSLLGVVDGPWLCCRVGHGTGPALTWPQWL